MAWDDQINCAGCGYDMLGLPGEGRCPECGNKYDMDRQRGITRRSAAMLAHDRGDRVVYLVKLWGLIGLGLVCVGIGGLLAIGAKMPERPILLGLMFGSMFGFGAFVTWFTEGRSNE